VDASRIQTRGYGSSQPIADNTTEAGKQANRRVEIAIYANEKMKKAAEEGRL
jgi:outer membrane protein OmpA-like peptidoglycan-associated protein